MKRHPIRTYNILLPIWMLVWFPSWLWLILIPANYLIDRLVLSWGLGDMEDKGTFCRANTWKICIAGFLSDLAGSVLLFMSLLVSDAIPGTHDFGSALSINPFENIFALLVTLAAIALAGFCIFKLDRWLLGKAGLDAELARRAALRLALVTAPYLFLVPGTLIYG